MCFGRLLLAVDAAHVVPPTGAKGLNLAASDIYYLHRAMRAFFADHDSAALPHYSKVALDRVENQAVLLVVDNLTHRFSDDRSEQKMKEAELAYVTTSEVGRQMVAENYVLAPVGGISQFWVIFHAAVSGGAETCGLFAGHFHPISAAPDPSPPRVCSACR